MMYKRFIVLIALLFFGSLSVKAQSFSLVNTVNNTPVNNGDTIYVTGTDPFLYYSGDLSLTNNSNSVKSVLIQKYFISLNQGTAEFMSFGTVCCMNSNVLITPIPTVINPFNSVPFNTTYDPNGITGTSYIKYTFFDQNNTSDSISVIYIFQILAAVGIDNELSNEGIYVYPNPTYDSVKIIFGDVKSINSVELYDLMGKLILNRSKLNASDQYEINLKDQPKGVYIFRASSEDKKYQKVIRIYKQ